MFGELEPKLDWRQLLYKHILNLVPIDYRLTPPSKKSHSLGIYLPSVHKERFECVVAIDTSGSISQEMLKDFVSEVLGILLSFESAEVHVISCDAQVQTVQTVSNFIEVSDIEVKGGGGTSFVPVFEYLKENLPDTKLVIYLTDGYGTFPNDEEFRTIWLITSRDVQPPFGERVQYEVG
jgi:predicted metal-dependent peptidase